VLCLHMFAVLRESFSVYNIIFLHLHKFLLYFLMYQLQHGHVVETSKKGIPHGLTAGTDAGELCEIRNG